MIKLQLNYLKEVGTSEENIKDLFLLCKILTTIPVSKSADKAMHLKSKFNDNEIAKYVDKLKEYEETNNIRFFFR